MKASDLVVGKTYENLDVDGNLVVYKGVIRDDPEFYGRHLFDPVSRVDQGVVVHTFGLDAAIREIK